MSLKSASKSRYYPQLAKDIHPQIKEEARYVRDALYDLRDSSQWQIQNLTLSRNLAFNPDVTPGKPLLLIAQQDAVGGFTLTFDPKFKGTTPTVAPAANAFTLSLFYPKSESEVLTIAGGGGGGGGVPPTRLIATTLPLTGGGDLSADRTLGINVFTAAVRGAVPPPGVIVGNVLSDSGAWVALAGGGTVTSVGSGTGIDAVPNPIVGVGVLNLATRAATSIMGNNTGGALAPLDLTGTQVTAMLNIFTASGVGHLKGLVPDPGAVGGNTKFLREDASWQAVSAAPHNMFSASHADTTGAAAPVDGDIIVGNVTPLWSKLAISIPAANVRNVLGIDNGELRPSWKTALDATAPTTIGVSDAAAAGTSLVFSHRDHLHGSPATFPATAHNLLSATHGDTTAAAVVQGDLVYGDAAPKWVRLAANATATKKYLQSVSGAIPAWQQVNYADLSGAPPAGAAEKITVAITQAAHGFAVGNAIYYTGAAWAKAKADVATTLGIGIVSTITPPDDFVLCMAGHMTGLAGLTAGEYYYVDAVTAGALTVTEPATYSNPIFFAESTTTGIVLQYRPSLSASAFTAGSVIFAGASGALSEDNANFFWDATKHYLGLGITAPLVKLHESETKTLAASPADDYSAGIRQAPAYTGAFTVSRHNYLDLLTPTVAAGAAVTEAAVMRFDAAAGTHKAVAAGNIDTSGFVKINVNGALGYIPYYLAAAVTPPYSLGYIAGLICTYVSTTEVDFTAGAARNSTNVVNIDNASTIRKILNAAGAWTAGTNQNGLDTGARGNLTWYHCYAIRKDSDGTADFLFSTSATAPSMPAGYTYKRRIGAVLTDSGGNILKWIQLGDVFWWDIFRPVVSGNITNARVTYVVSAPLGLATTAILHGLVVTSGLETTRVLVTNPSQTDSAPVSLLCSFDSSGTGLTQGANFECLTDTSSQVGVRGENTRVCYLSIMGWRDPRGKDA